MPSRKNSGLDTTSKVPFNFSPPLAKILPATCSAVPTGTVLLSTITL